MKLRLILFGLLATFMFAAYSKDDGYPDTLPKTEAELKTNITKKWDIASNNTYKSIEFMDNATFKVAKQDGISIEGTYSIGEDLQTLILTNFGVVTLTNLTSDKFNFSVKPTGSDKEINCSCSPATVKILISEIQSKIGDFGFKPEKTFTYDANGLLKEANEYSYNSKNGKVYYTYKYTFSRDKDNKLTKIEVVGYYGLVLSLWKIVYTFVYTGNNITQINKVSYDNNNKELVNYVYHYTWQNGKVIKIGQDDDTIVFEYKNGNYAGQKYSGTKVKNGVREEYSSEIVNTYDINKKNWYSYIPIEYILVSDPYDLEGFYPFCDNNVINNNKKYGSKLFNVELNKLLPEYSNILAITYTYTYNSKGLVDEYKKVNVHTNKMKNHKTKKNKESTKTYKTKYVYKIKYVEL